MSKVKFDLPAGIKVGHTISGLEGVITSRVERLNGCIQYIISSPLKEGEADQKITWSDLEDIEILDDKVRKEIKPEEVSFAFNTGDRVKNLVHDITGIVTVRRIDKNGCISYWYENGERNPETGAILEFFGFEQELSLVDSGLNQSEETKPKKKKTGCTSIKSSMKGSF